MNLPLTFTWNIIKGQNRSFWISLATSDLFAFSPLWFQQMDFDVIRITAWGFNFRGVQSWIVIFNKFCSIFLAVLKYSIVKRPSISDFTQSAIYRKDCHSVLIRLTITLPHSQTCTQIACARVPFNHLPTSVTQNSYMYIKAFIYIYAYTCVDVRDVRNITTYAYARVKDILTDPQKN